ncbi:Squalene--hopene cyclase [Planctomycetes bacterium Pan216]|uniref:Squalene--hopene cyclase n=1 Tax=Kolteria novifilia TaxID=2527975 RepID=A0A518B8I0_9BACT|nr:Squalene--hopene cyclase [Planctomycetes bacterium Pan216]
MYDSQIISRLRQCANRARTSLLSEQHPNGSFSGELASSSLSTATAVTALHLVIQNQPEEASRLVPLVDAGLAYLATNQNQNGGWGDTNRSFSNISTSFLAVAAFHVADAVDRFSSVVEAGSDYVDRMGEVEGVRKRYGKDRTFSVPILTQAALAGLVDWNEVAALPFELAVLPAQLYKTVKLPVVSYALPALIAVGQARFHHAPPRGPLRWIRQRSIEPSLRVLESIQPPNGGFLEATPLTSFVTMSLVSVGLVDHPVVRRGVEFLVESAREDGSWAIDTNLATWVTTLAVNSLGDQFPAERAEAVRDWLLDQQYRTVHPYTNADPGGWAWTDLPGGVPDADDTPGALLALRKLPWCERTGQAVSLGLGWLLDLQNRDGGWPTFCRGWGYLPFDRSAPDLTAHALRAMQVWRGVEFLPARTTRRIERSMEKGLTYLARKQRKDGSWLPLWFGNQHCPDDENPTYGTSRVLAAYRDLDLLDREEARLGFDWLIRNQHESGGWGGGEGPPSVEETTLALEVLLDVPDNVVEESRKGQAISRGLEWVCRRVEEDSFDEPSPIGFYFAKLWYFEKLYSIIFCVGLLERACRESRGSDDRPSSHSRCLPETMNVS